MPDEPTRPLYDRLERLEHELERLTAAVGRLGIKPCSWCKKFLRSSEPATFFSRDTPVCYQCVPEWWRYQCNQLSVHEREIIERQLKTWLLRYRHAEVVRGPEKLPKDPPPHLRIVVSCNECQATGYLNKVRCGFCDGRGTVWIVVR